MRKRKLFCLLLTAAFAVTALCACGTGGPEDKETDTQKTGEGKMAPKLTSLTLDDGYTIDFSADVYEYKVEIPAGRPRIPKVSAIAGDEARVKIYQATIPDSQNSGRALAVVEKDGLEREYSVNFEKTDDKGFYLQYADIYTFVPDYTLGFGERFDFESTNRNAAKVDSKGNITAVGLSDKPVVITAAVNGAEVDRLVIDRIVKASLNIFLIIGQSNAYGYHDLPNGADFAAYFAEQKAKSDRPKEGTVYADDIKTSYDDCSFSGMYDLFTGRNGFSPALGKEWYELTGEKTLMLQTAIGSTPIEAWTSDPSMQFYGIDCYAVTVERFGYYRDMFSAADSKFEINRIYAFWLQGETCEEYIYSPETFTWESKNGQLNYKYIGDWYNTKDPRLPNGLKLMTAKEYYDYFISMYKSFTEDIGLEFIGILPVRAMTGVSSSHNLKTQQLVDLVPPRVAQFVLDFSDNGNIAIVTLKTEVGRTESYADTEAEGWGYLGCNNIHYNQIGYNAIGRDSADNVFGMVSADTSKKATDIKILDYDGSTELTENSEVKIFLFETRQITATVLPLFAEDSTLTFVVEDTDVCTVNEFGLIKISKDAELGDSTHVTVTNGNISKTITVKVG